MMLRMRAKKFFLTKNDEAQKLATRHEKDGVSFRSLETEFGLSPASGMTAYHVYQYVKGEIAAPKTDEKKKDRRVTVDFSKETLRELHLLSKTLDVSVAETVRRAVQDFVKRSSEFKKPEARQWTKAEVDRAALNFGDDQPT